MSTHSIRIVALLVAIVALGACDTEKQDKPGASPPGATEPAGTPSTPATPATPGTPATPATPGTPGTTPPTAVTPPTPVEPAGPKIEEILPKLTGYKADDAWMAALAELETALDKAEAPADKLQGMSFLHTSGAELLLASKLDPTLAPTLTKLYPEGAPKAAIGKLGADIKALAAAAGEGAKRQIETAQAFDTILALDEKLSAEGAAMTAADFASIKALADTTLPVKTALRLVLLSYYDKVLTTLLTTPEIDRWEVVCAAMGPSVCPAPEGLAAMPYAEQAKAFFSPANKGLFCPAVKPEELTKLATLGIDPAAVAAMVTTACAGDPVPALKDPAKLARTMGTSLALVGFYQKVLEAIALGDDPQSQLAPLVKAKTDAFASRFTSHTMSLGLPYLYAETPTPAPKPGEPMPEPKAVKPGQWQYVATQGVAVLQEPITVYTVGKEDLSCAYKPLVGIKNGAVELAEEALKLALPGEVALTKELLDKDKGDKAKFDKDGVYLPFFKTIEAMEPEVLTTSQMVAVAPPAPGAPAPAGPVFKEMIVRLMPDFELDLLEQLLMAFKKAEKPLHYYQIPGTVDGELFPMVFEDEETLEPNVPVDKNYKRPLIVHLTKNTIEVFPPALKLKKKDKPEPAKAPAATPAPPATPAAAAPPAPAAAPAPPAPPAGATKAVTKQAAANGVTKDTIPAAPATPAAPPAAPAKAAAAPAPAAAPATPPAPGQPAAPAAAAAAPAPPAAPATPPAPAKAAAAPEPPAEPVKLSWHKKSDLAFMPNSKVLYKVTIKVEEGFEEVLEQTLAKMQDVYGHAPLVYYLPDDKVDTALMLYVGNLLTKGVAQEAPLDISMAYPGIGQIEAAPLKRLVVIYPDLPLPKEYIPPPPPPPPIFCDKKNVEQTINNRKGALKFCYDKELPLNPDLSGKLVFKWVVGLDGRVSDINVVGDTLNNKKVKQCVTSVIGKLKFAKPVSGVCNVKKSFTFQPPD